SSFEEINFGSKLGFLSDDQHGHGDHSQSGVEDFQTMLRTKKLGNAETKAIIKAIKGSTIRAAVMQNPAKNEEVIVLAAADANSLEENLDRAEGLTRPVPDMKYS